MPPLSSAPATAFTSALEEWFRVHQRDLPWRRTTDPYAILVSEVMLQQTQIQTVLDRGYYTRWMAQFPDFASVAQASEKELLKAWEGLGYYRRARSLQRLCQVILSDHGGVMPQDPAAIRQLPGVGPYTAGAIASFAFNLPEPLVDGNVARVLTRLGDNATPIDEAQGRAWLWHTATTLVRAAAQPRHLNAALMELGQLHCRPGQPDCAACPVSQLCRTRRPGDLPVKKPPAALTDLTEHAALYLQGGKILLQQETGSRRTGLWRLPLLEDAPASAPALLRTRYGITRYRVTLWVHQPPGPAPALGTWVSPDELAHLPMPSPYRRALEAALRAAGDFQLEG